MYKHEKKKKKKTKIKKCNMHECYISKWMKIIEILFTPKTLNIFKCKRKILENIILYGKMYSN